MADEKGVFTTIDAFVKYINEHGETEGSVLAAQLGVSERNVEDWANILEKSKAARIVYKLGKMYVSPVTDKTATTSEAKQVAEVRREIAKEDVLAQAAELNRLTEKITDFNKYVGISEGILRSNSKEIKKVLDRINALQNEAAASFNRIKGKKDEVEKFSAGLDGMISKIAGGALPQGEPASAESGRAILEDVKAKMRMLEDSNAQMLKAYDEEVGGQREKLLSFNREMQREIKVLKEKLGEEEAGIRNYEGAVKSYDDERGRMKQQVERSRVEILDSVSRSREEIGSVYSAAAKELERVNAVLGEARQGLGGYVEMSNKLAEIKGDIADLTKEAAGIKEQIDSILQGIRSAEQPGAGKEEGGAAGMGSAEGAARKSSDRLRGAAKKAGSIKKKIDDLSG